MSQVRPFRIETSAQQLTDLKERLARTRFAPALSGQDWTHGTPPGYLAELVEYWHTTFDWRKAEEHLNELPQFLAEVGGVTLHFVHTKGVGPHPFPLLFSHGWPGSFVEVTKIIGPLTDPAAHGGDPADAFDVVAPSMPGFGFSPHPGTPGINPTVIGGLYDRLMTEVLGYPRYGAQGGDFGAQVSSRIGRDHGDHVAGIHLNLMGATPVLDSAPLTPAEQAFVAQAEHFFSVEGGYAQIQGTKPATLGAGLSDSPAGLAAWMVEKFRAWSDCDGDVESVFSKDELLTDITLYWLTNTITTSARLYYETMRTEGMLGRNTPGYVDTPTGFASFAKENFTPPREWVARAYNLQRFTEFDHGGHFAALERPEDLVTEIREFFRPLRA
ncbi:epoxide hydrolase family protein [Kibdelosporangium aridum]|uniref:Pimeloyl-ACP methyl ester carboxylesterase n=1 Tax=Kibdelosporangium aridum TaxID=2030 RepID=A0A1W2B6W5_KIBAR|nr:epoxide hydrolase family protein [Kibdelosporangium aridum]SMC68717.1 Pimeloyl-ACP methyl ester carboxylesterase [Kibdelosporangium aridum]